MLVEDIWNSIASSDENIEITDEQRKELDPRLESYQKNPREGKTWRKVKDKNKL